MTRFAWQCARRGNCSLAQKLTLARSSTPATKRVERVKAVESFPCGGTEYWSAQWSQSLSPGSRIQWELAQRLDFSVDQTSQGLNDLHWLA
jgi:hypothetical protein